MILDAQQSLFLCIPHFTFIYLKFHNFIHHFTGQPLSLGIFQQYFTANHHLCCLENFYFNRLVRRLTLPVCRSFLYRFNIWNPSTELWNWQHSPTLFPISLSIICTSQDLLFFAGSACVPSILKVSWILSKVLQKSSTSSFTLINILFQELQEVCKTSTLPSYKPHWLFPMWLCLSHCQTYFCLLQLLLVYVLQMPGFLALGFLDSPKPFFKD